jgi:hypothetical protein
LFQRESIAIARVSLLNRPMIVEGDCSLNWITKKKNKKRRGVGLCDERREDRRDRFMFIEKRWWSSNCIERWRKALVKILIKPLLTSLDQGQRWDRVSWGEGGEVLIDEMPRALKKGFHNRSWAWQTIPSQERGRRQWRWWSTENTTKEI